MPHPVQTSAELWDRALALLSRRAHARAELSRKLQRYQPTPEMVAEVLARLESAGWLDDARFASDVADSMARAGRSGPSRINARLRGHGVSSEVAATAVTGTEADWEAACREAAGAKISRGLDLADPKARAKLARYLAGRGFSPALVWKVIRGAGQNGDADEPADQAE